jgi:TetR/AcrR family transcriptional repressor of nem operon
MRYTKAHKQRTRKQILEAATRAFRAKGLRGTSIPKLMGQVDLTHGGFYAHFNSKEDLIAEACAQSLIKSSERLVDSLGKASPGETLRTIVNAYLSPEHRDNPAGGCVIPSLAGELSRESDAVRRAFTQALERYVAQLAPLLSSSATSAADDAVLALVAGMAGGILLARAVDDPTLSDRILQACREFYMNVCTASDARRASDEHPRPGAPGKARTPRASGRRRV